MRKPFITVRNSFIYDAIQEKIEVAIAYGYRRAHKHVDNPTEEQIVTHITEQMQNTIHEIFDINTLDEDSEDGCSCRSLAGIGSGDIDDQQP